MEAFAFVEVSCEPAEPSSLTFGSLSLPRQRAEVQFTMRPGKQILNRESEDAENRPGTGVFFLVILLVCHGVNHHLTTREDGRSLPEALTSFHKARCLEPHAIKSIADKLQPERNITVLPGCIL